MPAPVIELQWAPLEPNIQIDASGLFLRAVITLCGRSYHKVVRIADFEAKGGRKAALTYLHRWVGSCRFAAKRFSVDDDDLMPRYTPPRRYASQFLLWCRQS